VSLLFWQEGAAQDGRISVKERTQVFNKIVSENSLNSKNSLMPSKKRFDKVRYTMNGLSGGGGLTFNYNFKLYTNSVW
jgi:hypothetical protein